MNIDVNLMTKCDLNPKWNNDKCWCDCKNLKEHHVCKKEDIGNPAKCICKNGKYFASIIDGSVIACNEITETAKTVPTKRFSTSFYILPTFLLIIISLLYALSIYCYLIKYKAKIKKTTKTFITILHRKWQIREVLH